MVGIRFASLSPLAVLTTPPFTAGYEAFRPGSSEATVERQVRAHADTNMRRCLEVPEER
jgi:hypothetical protein